MDFQNDGAKWVHLGKSSDSNRARQVWLSDRGDVWTVSKTGKAKQVSLQATAKTPYRLLWLEGKPHHVHALVLAHFVGPRPEGCVAMHLNHDKHDCRAENLKWGTEIENRRHTLTDGKVPYYLTPAQVRSIRRQKESPGLNRRLAEKHGLTTSAIYAIRARIRWAWLT